MDLSRFKTLAEAYGTERRRWPENAQPLYERFANTPEGATILAEAERIDRFLDALEVASPDDDLAPSIVAEALASARSSDRAEGGRTLRLVRLRWPLGAIAASAIIGFALGFSQVRDDGGPELVAKLLLGPVDVREVGL